VIGLWILLALLAFAGFLVLWVIGIYNGLITQKNRTEEAWSDIDVQLKRRHDLIPNLIETVKGYAAHEKEVFEKVTQARTAAMGAGSMSEKAGTENFLSSTLKTLFAVAENYPELKSNENFLALQEELTDTENKVEAARRFYNGNVRDFNIKIEVFPNSIIAQMFKFGRRELFEIEEAVEREPVKVKF
jgi:LemA protein